MYAAAVLLLCVGLLPASLVRGQEETSPGPIADRAATAVNVKEARTGEHYIDTTTSSFTQLLHNSTVFVDRSLLIKELVEVTQTFIYVSVPPKFGKSVNLDMVRFFIELKVDKFGEPLPRFDTLAFRFFKKGIWETADKTEQFTPPVVSRYNFLFDDYLSRYPVVYLDFSNFKATNYTEFKAEFAQIVLAQYQQHKYITHMLTKRDSTEATNEKAKFLELLDYKERGHDLRLEHSIRFLTQVLSKVHHRGVFVLIDNADFMHDILLHSEFLPAEAKRVFEFLRYFYRVTFHQNMFLKKTILFGTNRAGSFLLPFPVKVVAISHAIHNQFFPYFGVSETDFGILSDHFGIDSQLREKAQKNYLGYAMGPFQSSPTYCIWDVVNYLNERNVQSFWLQVSQTRFYLRNMMTVNEVRRAFERVLHVDMSIGSGYTFNHTTIIEKLQTLRDIIQTPHIGPVGGSMYRVLLQYFCDYGFFTYNYNRLQSNKLQKTSNVGLPNDEIIQNVRRDLQAYYREYLNLQLSSVGELCERLDKYVTNQENDLTVLENHFNLVFSKLELGLNQEGKIYNNTRFNYTILDSVMEYMGMELRLGYNYTVRVFAVPGIKIHKPPYGAVIKTNFYSNSTPEKILEASGSERWFVYLNVTDIKVLALKIDVTNKTSKLFQGTVAPWPTTNVTLPQQEATLPPEVPADDGTPPPEQ